MKKKGILNRITSLVLTFGLVFGEVTSPVAVLAADDEAETVIEEEYPEEDLTDDVIVEETPDGASGTYISNPPSGWELRDSYTNTSSNIYYGIYYIPSQYSYGLYICPNGNYAHAAGDDSGKTMDAAQNQAVENLIATWQGHAENGYSRNISYAVIAGIKSFGFDAYKEDTGEIHWYNYLFPKGVRSTIYAVDIGILEDIPIAAFSYCPMLDIRQFCNNISHSNIKTIGAQAFRECTRLVIEQPSTEITTIGNYAFEDCTEFSWTYFEFNNLVNVGSGAFKNTGITTMTLNNPGIIQTFGYGSAFEGTDVDYIVLNGTRSWFNSWAGRTMFGNANFILSKESTSSSDRYAFGEGRVQNISVPANQTIKAGQSYTINPTFTPSDAVNKEVRYTSSNTNVATVTSGGKVTGVSAGTATITVTSQDTSMKTIKASLNVTVIIPVDSVTISPKTIKIKDNETAKVTATISPSNAENKNYSFSSSDTSVATVAANGTITAKKAGTATITVTTEDGQKTDTCAVTVTASVKGVTASPKSLNLFVGDESTLLAVITPSNAENKNVSFESSDTSVATVTSDGKISAKKAGSAVITITTEEGGFTDTCTVTVKNVPVSGVSVTPKTMTLLVNETGNLSATVTPSNAYNKKVSYSSNNTEVAIVNTSGVVTGLSVGKATITVTTEDGSFTDTCIVTVNPVPVSGVSISPKTLSIKVGESGHLSATVLPADAGNKNVTYLSSDTTVATVTSDGTVSGVKVGTATITVTTVDGAKTDTCEVTVLTNTIAVTGVSISPKTLGLKVGEEGALIATVTPDNATEKGVSFESSNTAVASVNAEGIVTALKAGTASIKVTTADGSFTDSCSVTVTDIPVESVSLTPSEVNLKIGATAELVAKVLPENAENKNVTYTSTDESVATVSESGVITAVAEGEAVITVKTEDGNKTATCLVTVLKDTVAVTGVTVEPRSVELKVGEKQMLTATVSPNNATETGVTYESGDNLVATVSENGEILAVGEGTTVITVKTVDGSFTDSCSVTVIKGDDIPVSSVSVSPKTLNIKEGESGQLIATIAPENASVKDVLWESDNTAVALVDESGLVSGVSEGTAVITVTTVSGNQVDTCVVTISPKEEDPGTDSEYESYDKLDEATEPRVIYLVKGQKVRIAGCSVSSGNNKTLSAGKLKGGYTMITAKKTGATTIDVTNVSGNTLTHTVYIESPSFVEKKIKLTVGQVKDFSVNLGANTDKYRVFFTSSNPDVVNVLEGKVYGVSKGNATVYAHINGKRYACKVSVKDPSAPSDFAGSASLDMVPLQSFVIKAKGGFKVKGATWSVSGDNVVKIEKNKITAIGLGSAKVSGTDVNGKTFTVDVTVSPASVQTLHIALGKSKSIRFYKLVNKNAQWTSSDASVVSVENGKVKGLKAGKATITATYEGFNFITNVTVEEPVLKTGSKLTQSGKKYELKLIKGEAYTIESTGTDTVIAWISNKPEVVRVNGNGRIITCSAGTAKLTGKVGGKTFTINVTVTEKTGAGL